MRRWFPVLIALPLTVFAEPGLSEEEAVRRVQAHLLIEDANSALREAKEYVEAFPKSRVIHAAYIEALSANGLEEEALKAFNRLAARHPDLVEDRPLLEELGWGVLHHGIESSQYAVRLAALIGTYLTHDVRAVKTLLKMMRDSNAIIRSIAVQMAASFADAPLKDEIDRLMSEEKIWFVRLEVIRAAGHLRMKNLAPTLQAILSSEKNTFEERQLAVEALVQIYDQISYDEFKALSRNTRAGMRHLACMLATHFRLKEAKDDIARLTKDPHPAVRVAALSALGLVYLEETGVYEIIEPALEEPHPGVAITAAWVATLLKPEEADKRFGKWLSDDLPENRRLAAAALTACGDRGAQAAVRALQSSADPYVRANLALGLIGQRVEVSACCDILYAFMMGEKRMWMIDNRANPLFQVLSPSQVRHIDQIPNYPEAIDQMTRLKLVSVLALVDDPRAQEALKSFLQRKTWGITGVAATTLLQEGDEGALEVVRSLLSDPDPNVRLQACLVLAQLGKDESVVVELQNAYVGSDHERKLHILEAMGQIGTAESVSFFLRVLEEPFPILRVASAAGLIQSLNR